MADQDSDEMRQQAKDLLQQAMKDAVNRPVTEADCLYLRSLYPYLTISKHGEAFISHEEVPEVLETNNGWRMFVYQSVVCIGTNYYRQGSLNKEGMGTLVKQGMDAISDLLDYVQSEKQWEEIEVIYGNYTLQRMVWIIAVHRHLRVWGFDPYAEDEVVRVWIQQMLHQTFYPLMLR